MKNKIIVLIGAGQLGSRHLQGVLKHPEDLNIFVIDSSQVSIKTCKERIAEVDHKHNISFKNSVEDLPEFIDFAIIATNSDVRAKIIHNLLESKKVKNLLLEKVLFQRDSDYIAIDALLKETNTNTWVNHSRRCMPFYKDLRINLQGEEKLEVLIYGMEWGLASNALHFIDLISFLSDSRLAELNLEELNPSISKSKRQGFIEISGAISGRTTNGSSFKIVCTPSPDKVVKPVSLVFLTPGKRCFVQEGVLSEIITLHEDNAYKSIAKQAKMLYQSELTHLIMYDVIEKGTCDLPTYQECFRDHQAYINKVLTFYNNLRNENKELCPIT